MTKAEYATLMAHIGNLTKSVDCVAATVSVLAPQVAEALSRLNHPAAADCTQVATIDNLMRRMGALEKAYARFQGISAALGAIIALALSWIGKSLWGLITTKGN